MKYAAYLQIGEKNWPLFPKSKKTTLFKTQEEAIRALEKKTRHMIISTRGFVVPVLENGERGEAYTIAL